MKSMQANTVYFNPGPIMPLTAELVLVPTLSVDHRVGTGRDVVRLPSQILFRILGQVAIGVRIQYFAALTET